MITDNKVCSKVVITYADPVWIEVLLEYWEEWRRSQADPVVPFKFSEEIIHGKLFTDHGGGWTASRAGKYTVHKREVDYDSVPGP